MAGNALSKKLGFAGSAVGLALYLSFGLLHGVLTGGTAAVEAGTYIIGATGMAARLLAGGGMLAGAMVSGFVFICGGFSAGWLLGLAIGEGKEKSHAGLAVRNR